LNWDRFRQSPAAGHSRASPKPRPYPQVAFCIVGFLFELPSPGTQRRTVRIPKFSAWRPPTPIWRQTTPTIKAGRGERLNAVTQVRQDDRDNPASPIGAIQTKDAHLGKFDAGRLPGRAARLKKRNFVPVPTLGHSQPARLCTSEHKSGHA